MPDKVDKIDEGFNNYMCACYGRSWRTLLRKSQQLEIQQAFLSGIVFCRTDLNEIGGIELAERLKKKLQEIGILL